MAYFKALWAKICRGKRETVMKCRVVYSLNSNDLHLELSARYATALISKLKKAGKTCAVYEESGDDWSSFRQDLSEHLDEPESIVFFTHGNIDHHSGYNCSIKLACSRYIPTERCSCAICYASDPVLSTSRTHLLLGDSVHGATACYLGSIFGAISVRNGANCFIGYTDEFRHIRCNDIGTNPFEDIVNSITMSLLDGIPAEEVRERAARRYSEWVSKNWENEQQPQDWWLIQACLRNNLACLNYH